MPDDDKDIQASLQKLLDRHNGESETVAGLLFRENHSLREDKRTLRVRVDELESKKPSEGSMVLSKEEAEAWTAYSELGKPEEIKEKIGKVSEYEGELSQIKRRGALSEAAKIINANGDVLSRLIPADSEILLKDVNVTKDGKSSVEKVPFIKTSSGETQLSQFIDVDLKDFHPAIYNQPKGQAQGASLPPQGKAGENQTNGVDSLVDGFNKRRNPEDNPLLGTKK